MADLLRHSQPRALTKAARVHSPLRKDQRDSGGRTARGHGADVLDSFRRQDRRNSGCCAACKTEPRVAIATHDAVLQSLVSLKPLIVLVAAVSSLLNNKDVWVPGLTYAIYGRLFTFHPNLKDWTSALERTSHKTKCTITKSLFMDQTSSF